MDGGSAALQNLIFFGLLLLGVYFLAIRPQRSRARALAQVRAQMHVGSTVMTTAGIHATVAELDGDTVLLEVAPGVRVRFASQAVVRLLDDPATPEADADPAP
jgi:preprotein translocase subunit YajC